MNLNLLANSLIGSVNPNVPADVRISTGYGTDSSFQQVPTYATPGAFTGSISGTTLDVSAISSGKLMAGQIIAGTNVENGTVILAQLTGVEGGVGTYQISPSQDVSLESMTTSYTLQAQVQPLTTKDLMHLDGLNIQGVERAIYLSGHVDGIVRSEGKGGDLIILSSGPNPGTYLVTVVLEAWSNWVKCGVRLQNGG